LLRNDPLNSIEDQKIETVKFSKQCSSKSENSAKIRCTTGNLDALLGPARWARSLAGDHVKPRPMAYVFIIVEPATGH
jgi:hypothetical protein